MRVFNIKVDSAAKTIETLNSFSGEIAFSSAYVMPKWYKPQQDILFSFEKKGKKVGPFETSDLYSVKIQNGKTYTLTDLNNLLHKHIGDDIGGFNYYNNRVLLTLKKDPNLLKLNFCPEIIHKFKLPIFDNYVTGEQIQGLLPINENDLAVGFNNTNLFFIRCKQLDTTVNFEDSETSDLLTVVPLKNPTIEGQFVIFESRNICWKQLDKRYTKYKLEFSLEDPFGNQLPCKNGLITVLNKHER